MNGAHQMTSADVDRVAHEIRLQIQAKTCCPHHAGAVLMRVLAGFALDDAGDDKIAAAATILQAATDVARRVRLGEVAMLRSKQ